MASDKKIAANRRNAIRSTGPRTSEGKNKVALNALKHGLLAQHVVLPNEDEREFAEFSRGLEQQLQPVGELEVVFVGLIAACAWRLRRLMRVEKGLFIEYASEKTRLGAVQAKSEPAAVTFHIYRGDDSNEEAIAAHERAEEAEERARKAEERAREAEEQAEEVRRLAEQAGAIREAGDAGMGRAFIADAQTVDAFSKLSRYEAHIQRSMCKALDELQRLQEARSQSTSGPGSEAPDRLQLEKRNGDSSA